MSNGAPYCAELFSPQNMPYAFHFADLPGMSGGFPLFLDVNLDAKEARRWMSYARDGMFLSDSRTSVLEAKVVSFNAVRRCRLTSG